MWLCLADRILWQNDGKKEFQMQILEPDFESFLGSVVSLAKPEKNSSAFDAWLSQFPREDEITLVTEILEKIHSEKNSRFHIRGLSTREALEMVREYYAECGYEDELAKNYTLPDDVRLTVSVNLRHALWCEKDKQSLSKTVNTIPQTQRKSLYEIVPPMRSPSDLRFIQQCLRMGVVMGIEVFPGDEKYLSELLTREILIPYQIAQAVGWKWERYNFFGKKREYILEVPVF